MKVRKSTFCFVKKHKTLTLIIEAIKLWVYKQHDLSRIAFEFYLLCLLLHTETGLQITEKHTDEIFISSTDIFFHVLGKDSWVFGHNLRFKEYSHAISYQRKMRNKISIMNKCY